MARRKKRDGGGVSLFPFMSILACLIGILTLLISVSLIIKEKEQEGYTQEELELAQENKALKNQAKKLRAEILTTQQAAQQNNIASVSFKKLKDKSLNLSIDLKEISKGSDQTDEELQKLVENMKLETKAIVQEQPSLIKRQKELLAQIEKLKLTPKPTPSVLIRPGGVSKDIPKNLFFVECNSTGISLLEKDKKGFTISTAAIAKSDEFLNFCSKVKQTKDSMILFLVRRSGNNAFLWAAGTAEAEFEVKTGKLPIPNEGKIDTSLFNQ